MNRRHFLGLLPGTVAWASGWAAAPAMKVTKLETFYWSNRDAAPFWPHWTWLRIHTDTGLIGLGETYPRNRAEAAILHDYLAPGLLNVSKLSYHCGEIKRGFGFAVFFAHLFHSAT